ncbi:putative FAD synthetase [Myxozyma melibiosi]|uniref:FAD synthase n=1 Tax=Myxozyma melibiosi TaxID=54550 RepID=A0ABR1EY85_9ASCO
MLVLLLASIHYHKAEYAPQRIHSVYVQSANAFEEVDEFVMECGEQYSLDLIRVPGPMKAAFEKFLSARPQIKAIMVGTRRTDPNGAGLGDFDETDGGWPRFMRIQPVIEWQYEEVWFFLREVGIKYCVLYDLGYTSLGGTTDTFKNPALRVGEEYLPAHELEDGTKERMGRA